MVENESDPPHDDPRRRALDVLACGISMGGAGNDRHTNFEHSADRRQFGHAGDALRRFWQPERGPSAMSGDRPPVNSGLKERLMLWAWVEGIILGIALMVWSFLA